jgi:hypothetical protein
VFEDFLTDQLAFAVAVGGKPDPLGGPQRFANGCQLGGFVAESGATRTPIPAQGGQQSGDCGQRLKAA